MSLRYNTTIPIQIQTLKFKHRSDMPEKSVERCKQFYISLQKIAPNWVALGATKTAMVYRLKGNPPQAHE